MCVCVCVFVCAPPTAKVMLRLTSHPGDYDRFLHITKTFRIAVFTHFQTNENPCSSKEKQVLFEHGLRIEILQISPV